MSEGLPENNTPTPQDVWEHELTFHSESVTAIGRASGDYYLLFLPYKIQKFNWKTGEDHLLLKKIDDDPPYIKGLRAEAEENNHRRVSLNEAVYSLRTQGSNRPRVAIPKMWADEFLNYGGDEALSVELNEIEEEPHIRIYGSEGVQKRKAQLINEGYSVKDGPSRVVAPLGIAYSIKKFALDKVSTQAESIEVNAPERAPEDSVITMTVEADLPDLKRLLVQHRHEGEPGFTDIDEASAEPITSEANFASADNLPRPFKMDISYDHSEDEGSIFSTDGPEVHEFRARAIYKDEETMNSDIQTVKIE